MIEFTHIRYGVLLALIAILFGGSLGLSFGCCEEDIKAAMHRQSGAVMAEKYEGNQALADKVIGKSWVYLKRAHLHSQTMGVISIVLSLIAAWLAYPPPLQRAISLLSGFGSLGYGVFWLLSAALAPGMGSTGAAKDSVALVAQASAGSFFIASILLFALLVYKMFSPSKPLS